jgi:hypothetical protein
MFNQQEVAIAYAARRKDEWTDQYNTMLMEQRPQADQPPQKAKISLANLLDIHKIYTQHADEFLPHPDGDEADAVVAEWAKGHGIWIEDGKGTKASAEALEMTKYLARGAVTKERLILINKINMIAYFVDDTAANEFQKKLKPVEREQVQAFFRGVLRSMLTGEENEVAAPPGFSGFNQAVKEVMSELRHYFKDGDPTGWLPRFIESLRDHLMYAVMDHNTSTTGEVMSTSRYYWFRNKVSGMEYTNLLAEFAIDKFLDHQELKKYPEIKKSVLKLNYLSIVIAAFLNDYFSPEKEIFDEGDEFNLIANLLLNNEDLTLLQAITVGAEMINKHTREFFEVRAELEQQLQAFEAEGGSAKFVDVLRGFSKAMQDEIFAAWVWQIYTGRYLREESIFEENTRSNEAVRQQLIPNAFQNKQRKQSTSV